MAAPYSQDLRDRVLRAYQRGVTTAEVARTLAVCRSWARRVKQRHREHGETAPRKMGNPGICKVDRARLRELVEQRPDATLVELREELGVRCGLSTICKALKKMGLTFKKRSSAPRSRIGRMSSSGVRSGVPGPAAPIREN